MEIRQLKEEDMNKKEVSSIPASFTKGNEEKLSNKIQEVNDFYPEELDMVLNSKLRVCGFNIIQNKLLAIDVMCENVEDRIKILELSDYKILDEKNARLWLR